MVAISQQQQQQATTTAQSAEEEALKRNTDCVYFLASPLTCKKGSECEYRHSEYARVNPRDCYFWLNGNCLNPRCGFRHPPLDGLVGTQAKTSAGPSLPQMQKMTAAAVHNTQNSDKQSVRCIFFQKGLCLKGDKCAFLHGPSPASKQISQPIGPSTGAEPPTESKAYSGTHKFNQDRKVPQANFSKAVEASVEAKHALKPEMSSQRHGVGVERNLLPSKGMDDEVPKPKATNLHPVVNGDPSRINRRSQVPDDPNFQNGRDVDDFLRETSPGFDVLVDDELRNSDFYHGEDQYGRINGHEGRNLNSMDHYGVGNSADDSPVNIGGEAYNVLRGYDTNEHMQGQHAWDQHQSSLERMPLGPARVEKQGFSKSGSSGHIDDADLRHRLLEHRRINGLRSVVSHDFVSDNHVDERGHRSSSGRDSHNVNSHLHGRIKLAARSPNGSDLHVETEVDKGRTWNRSSPGIPSRQGRLRDRIKARVEEDNSSEGKGSRMRPKTTDDRSADFAGPKSLAELKGMKSIEGTAQQSFRKRKQMEDHQLCKSDISFEGPMPLSEILKRKREAGSGSTSLNKPENNQKENNESNFNNAALGKIETGLAFSRDESTWQVLKDNAELQHATTVENAGTDASQHRSQPHKPSDPKMDVGTMVDEVAEKDQEHDAGDQAEGDFEYEQGDEEEYYEEGENAGGEEEEYVDGEEEYIGGEDGGRDGDGDGDGDDFARKIGVMFS